MSVSWLSWQRTPWQPNVDARLQRVVYGDQWSIVRCEACGSTTLASTITRSVAMLNRRCARRGCVRVAGRGLPGLVSPQ